MITFCTWRWGTKYGPEYVDRLYRGVAKHYTAPHRFVTITNQPDTPGDTLPIDDEDLLSVRDGCYARLRMFDPHWQAENGIERLVCLDLDLIVVGDLAPLFSRPDHFMILHGGHYNPCPFNGSVMMLDRGARPELWSCFNLDEAERVANADGIWRGSDQTWIAHVAPDAKGWTWRDGVYAYGKPGWPGGNKPDDALPANARIVAFPGKRDPSTVPLPWVRDNWR